MDENNKLGGVEGGVIGGLGVASVLAAIFVKWWVGLILAVLLLFLVGAYLGLLFLKRRRRERQFSHELQQHASLASSGAQTAQDKASLDKLRAQFNKGIQVYKNRGKDIYSVPWYLFIGTPGSGKTEAIRHSDISFPPGLTQPMQGSGGTINMDWWFTDNGVILDTAGAMVFPKAGNSNSPEWEEFLRMVRKSRPECPINGLFLALPVDSLIGDSGEKISEKAGRIAEQLDRIQRILDVRFPVYILITKCDRMVGFKDYFENLSEPQHQHQILGWSNPDPRDEPFKPDGVDEYLKGLMARLKARRATVLRNATALDPAQGTRLDAVDTTFALPDSLVRIVPRLKRYLQHIFSASAFSAKPVFLRGIYFTSAMQQGQALDEAVAQALGIDVNTLGDGGFHREKSYFLRDLFMEKAFREKLLVTAASNTRRMLRNRRMYLIGIGFAALALVGAFSVIGWLALNRAVREESEVWNQAASHWGTPGYLSQTNHYWHPIIVNNPAGDWIYDGANTVDLPFEHSSLSDFHVQLCARVRQPLHVSWIFKPVDWCRPRQELNHRRKVAQRVLLEQSVLLPLIESVRVKMAAMRPENMKSSGANLERDARLRKALEALVAIEAAVDARSKQTFDTPKGREDLGVLLNSLTLFVTDGKAGLPTNLIDTCAWTFSKEGEAPWLPPYYAQGTNLDSSAAIKAGLECLIAQVKYNQGKVISRLAMLEQVCLAAQEFDGAEEILFKDSANNCDLREEHCQAFLKARQNLDNALRKALSDGEYRNSTNLLSGFFEQIQLDSQVASRAAFEIIARSAKEGQRPLFSELIRLCDGASGETEDRVKAVLSRYQAEIGRWEKESLAEQGGGWAYAIRANCYAALFELSRSRPDVGLTLGTEWKVLGEMRRKLDEAASSVDRYSGLKRQEFKSVCDCARQEAEKNMVETAMTAYAAFVQTNLQQLASQEAVTFETLKQGREFLSKLEKDLAPGALVNAPLRWQERLKHLKEPGQDIDVVKQKLINIYAVSAVDPLKKSLSVAGAEPLAAFLGFRALWQRLETNELGDPVVKYYPRPAIDTLRDVALELQGRSLKAYAEKCNTVIDKDLGFPLVFNEKKKLMDATALGEFRGLLKARREELDVLDKMDCKSEDVRRLRDRVQRLSATLTALLAGDGASPIKATIRVAQRQDPIAQGASRYAWISADDVPVQRLDFTHVSPPDQTKPFDIQQSLRIEITQFGAKGIGAPCNSGDESLVWGPLELIRKHLAKYDRQQDGRVWIVPIEVKWDGGAGVVNFEFEFSQPLPALGDWGDGSPGL